MRIAHITDLHVLSLDGVHVWDFFNQRVFGGANLLFNRGGEYPLEVCERLMADINAQDVDHVLVSGDLTNLSLPGELLRAREILEGLELPASEVTVVPGNHDCYTFGERLRANFSRTLFPYLVGDALDEGVSAPDSDAFKDFRRPTGFPFVRLRGPVAIVALSTAHVSPPLFATGSLGSRQIAAAEELLMHPELRRRFRLVVMHHPPRSPYATWQKRLKDADAFNAMIGRVGAEMIVHGHLHRDVNEELGGPDGPVPVVGANSSIWLCDDLARRASYGIYEIDDDGHFAGMERRAYDRDAERYV